MRVEQPAEKRRRRDNNIPTMLIAHRILYIEREEQIDSWTLELVESSFVRSVVGNQNVREENGEGTEGTAVVESTRGTQ